MEKEKKEFRIDGFYPSRTLCERMYKGIIRFDRKEELLFMVLHLWLHAGELTTLKAAFLRGVRENVGEMMARFFTAIAKRTQKKRGFCERLRCSSNGRFNPELTLELLDRFGLVEDSTYSYQVLILLHQEMAAFLKENPWNSSVIQVSSNGEDIYVDYIRPFPLKLDWSFLEKEEGWIVT